MYIDQIVSGVNTKLAGETLTYNQMRLFLDECIDDINRELDANFPVFTGLSESAEYNYFPDKYIRSVIMVGAAFKFYITDEEGAVTAPQYGWDYKDNLFYMKRDYSCQVPEAYRNAEAGYVVTSDLTTEAAFIKPVWRGW